MLDPCGYYFCKNRKHNFCLAYLQMQKTKHYKHFTIRENTVVLCYSTVFCFNFTEKLHKIR
eukprot:08407.XXX_384006_385019_1 [CDS] Oithona nana genome sequencing.